MWAATARRPSSQEEEREGRRARGKVLAHLPLQQGAWAERQLTRSSPRDQMFLVSELLAFNKLSYCKSVIRQGKHRHPTSPASHTSQILCPHRHFLESHRSTPGEGAMSQLLNLPVTFHPAREDGCYSFLLPPTRTLSIGKCHSCF